ncbi:MAG: hypothetical protein H0X17_18755 [Deltaproteobacteria bacterium]|nr:hypothetical protein [Deltaproteobacteria bacterium]
MQFGRWYPLTDAGGHAPASEGVLQLRRATGLLDYPRGKSAMVLYAHAPDVRAAAQALARAHPGDDLWCRHLIEIEGTTDLAAFCAKLRAEFERRFGSVPHLESLP